MKKRKILICAIALMAAFQLNNLSSIGPSIGLLQTAFAKSEEHRVKVTVMDYWYTNDLVPIKKRIREEKYYAVGEKYIYTDLPLKYSNSTELGTGYVNACQNSYDEHTITEADYKTYKEDGKYIIAFAYQYSEEDYNALMSQNIKDQIAWMDPADRRTTDTSGYMDDYPKYVQKDSDSKSSSSSDADSTSGSKGSSGSKSSASSSADSASGSKGSSGSKSSSSDSASGSKSGSGSKSSSSSDADGASGSKSGSGSKNSSSDKTDSASGSKSSSNSKSSTSSDVDASGEEISENDNDSATNNDNSSNVSSGDSNSTANNPTSDNSGAGLTGNPSNDETVTVNSDSTATATTEIKKNAPVSTGKSSSGTTAKAPKTGDKIIRVAICFVLGAVALCAGLFFAGFKRKKRTR